MTDFDAIAEEALGRYRELRRDSIDVKRQIDEITATAVSKRQSVKITVNVHGEILSIEFPSGAYKRMTPIELAEAIKSTALEAKAKALEELDDLMNPKMVTGMSFKDLMQGRGDLLAGLPEDPVLPDAVGDYLRRGLPSSWWA